LLLNRFADQLTGRWIDRSGSRDEDKISSAPPLRVRALRRCTALALNYVFGHVLKVARPPKSAASQLTGLLC
jgi:hypothetical protein